MGYWQIYTPPDHKRIAIQPVTFGGNVYTINAAKNGIWPLPQHGTSIISVWED